MSDYNRFVSYIYLYENGAKTMNAGFVKVESRNGQCRIALSLKNVYTGMERCQVYMFIRFGQELRGVYVGDVRIRNHGGEWKFVTDTANIAGSGYRLDQMSGMIIRGDGEKFYGTRWDHGDLDIRKFLVRWEENPPEREIVREREPSEEMKISQEGELPEETENTEAEEEIREMVLETEPSGEEAVIQETVESEEKIRDSEISGDEGKIVTMEEDKRCMSFRKILEQCPGMYPFEDDTVDACVRLEPQDIGRMPIDCWAYGSNSFLLHGYYSYRHLILARMKKAEEGGGGYILGVPGTRHSREAFMANMFGFRVFKPIREGKEGTSDFGYWYTFLA